VRSRRVFIQGWSVLLGVPALFVFAYFYPRFPLFSKLTFCSVRHFLGFDCPGCGLTRSFAELAHLRIRESVDAHPLGVVIALWLLYMWGRAAYASIAGRWPRAILTQQQRDWLLGAFVVALFLQWLVKLGVMWFT
jgi:hypothetical protein